MKVIRRIARFFAGVRLEATRVKWPTAGELARYSLVVIPFTIFLALFSLGITSLYTYILEVVTK